MTEINLTEQKNLREQYIERIEILDKVKKLFLIPDLEVATANQVAEYYEVGIDPIRKCYERNKDEIDNDGTSVKTYKDFLIGHNVTLENLKGKSIINIGDNIILEIPNRGIRCFSKRAILRFGMLLRDSKIAKEVRTQLLNVFENSTNVQKTEEIDNENKLLLDLARSYVSKDFDAFALANQNFIDYQNRHINALKNDNKALSESILEWEDRSKINKAVRIFANKLNIGFGTAWNQLYDELRYKHHIGLTQLGNPPYLQHVKEDEWALIIKSFSAICENNGVSPTTIMEKAKLAQANYRIG